MNLPPRIIPLVYIGLSFILSGGLHAESLFNGRNLNHWVVESGGDFSVNDGYLRVNRGTGWLRSAEAFADFTLVMEFRFLEEGANSGIFIRTKKGNRDDDTGWPTDGYQVQCMDTTEGGRPLGSMINYGGPESDDHTDIDALKQAYLPPGQWNLFVITCEDDLLTVQLNGRVVSTSRGVENSPGHIGIQAEYGLLEFRKIAVVEH